MSVYKDLNGRVYCDCVCDCTCEKNHVVVNSLVDGNTKSCGCLNSELAIQRNTKHGQAQRGKKTRLYEIWDGMRKRCDNPNCVSHKNYYDKGIKYCDEWNDFMNFKNWAEKNGYQDDLTLERKDNKLGYNPENCCWIPKGDQAKNRTMNNYITYNGETHTLAQWEKITGVKQQRIRHRLKKGLSIEQAFFNGDLRKFNKGRK